MHIIVWQNPPSFDENDVNELSAFVWIEYWSYAPPPQGPLTRKGKNKNKSNKSTGIDCFKTWRVESKQITTSKAWNLNIGRHVLVTGDYSAGRIVGNTVLLCLGLPWEALWQAKCFADIAPSFTRVATGDSFQRKSSEERGWKSAFQMMNLLDILKETDEELFFFISFNSRLRKQFFCWLSLTSRFWACFPGDFGAHKMGTGRLEDLSKLRQIN